MAELVPAIWPSSPRLFFSEPLDTPQNSCPASRASLNLKCAGRCRPIFNSCMGSAASQIKFQKPEAPVPNEVAPTTTSMCTHLAIPMDAGIRHKKCAPKGGHGLRHLGIRRSEQAKKKYTVLPSTQLLAASVTYDPAKWLTVVYFIASCSIRYCPGTISGVSPCPRMFLGRSHCATLMAASYQR